MYFNSGIPTYYIGLNQDMARTPLNPAAFSMFRQKTYLTETKNESLKDAHFIQLNIKGVRPEDVAVVTFKNQLIVEVEKEFQPFQLAHTNWDKRFGLFTRVFELPDELDPDQVRYQIDNGHLNLWVYKDKDAAKTREPRRPDTGAPEIGL